MALSSSPTNRLVTPRKLKVRWTEAAERKLIEAYYDVLEKYKDGGRWVTRKAKEEIVMKEVNEHVRNELHYESTYNYDEIHNKIDTMKKKAKIFAVRYQVKRSFLNHGHGQLDTSGEIHLDEDNIELNMDAAAMCWPNFRLYWERFKGYPSMWQPCREDNHTARDEPARVKSDDATPNDDSDCEMTYLENGDEPFATSSRSPSTVASAGASFRDSELGDCANEREQLLRPPALPPVLAAVRESELPARTCSANSSRPVYSTQHHVRERADTRPAPAPKDGYERMTSNDMRAPPRHGVPRLISNHRHHDHAETAEQSQRGRDKAQGYNERVERAVIHDWPSHANGPHRSTASAYSAHRRRGDHVDDADHHDRVHKRRPSSDGHVGGAAKRSDQGDRLYSGEYAEQGDDAQADQFYGHRASREVYGQLGYVSGTHYWPQEVRAYPQIRGNASERLEFMSAFQKLLEECQNRQFEHDQQLQIQWTEAQGRAERERRLFEQRMEQERRAFEQKAQQERRAFEERCEQDRDQLYSSLQKENQENQACIMQRTIQFLAELSRRLFPDH